MMRISRTYCYFSLLSILAVLNSSPVSAQRDIHFSQYLFQGVLINPAYAGSKNQVENTLAYRNQWAGLQGAPKYAAYTINSPIIHGSGGLGLQVTDQQFGGLVENACIASFSYRVRVRKGTLAAGAESGFRQYSFNTNDLLIHDANDPVVENNKTSIVPDLGLGMYYQTDKYHLGISAKKLLGKAYQQSPVFTENQNRYYSLFAGRKYRIGAQDHLLTTCFVNYSKDVPLLAEGTVIYQAQKGFWLGAAYRSSKEMSVLAGINLKQLIASFNEDLSLGYAYDQSFSSLQPSNHGSHELLLIYRFGKKPSPEQILKEKRAVHPVFF